MKPCVSDDSCAPTGTCAAATGNGHCVGARSNRATARVAELATKARASTMLSSNRAIGPAAVATNGVDIMGTRQHREPRVLGHRGARDVHVGRIHEHPVVGHQAMVRNHAFQP